MKIIETINKISAFMREVGFEEVAPAGVLFERLAYGKFNPSAGHHFTDPIINSQTPREIKKFHLLERCIREADDSRVGLSPRHLSFFEMFAFHSYGEYSLLPKKEMTQKYFHLLTNVLGLDENNMLVTILKNCSIENQTITEDETDEIFEEWVKLLGKDKVKRTGGRRNFFIARVPGAAGGTGFEVFYKMANEQYIEIGSQVAYHYIYRGPMNLHATINGTLGSGVGFERILMAIENVSSVYDISIIKPLKDIVISQIADDTEQLFDGTINIIVDHIRTIVFILYEKKSADKELTASQEKILKKLNKNMRSQVDYLGLHDDLYERLVDKVILLYKDRFPEIKLAKDDILDFINKKSQ